MVRRQWWAKRGSALDLLTVVSPGFFVGHEKGSDTHWAICTSWGRWGAMHGNSMAPPDPPLPEGAGTQTCCAPKASRQDETRRLANAVRVQTAFPPPLPPALLPPRAHCRAGVQ